MKPKIHQAGHRSHWVNLIATVVLRTGTHSYTLMSLMCDYQSQISPISGGWVNPYFLILVSPGKMTHAKNRNFEIWFFRASFC